VKNLQQLQQLGVQYILINDIIQINIIQDEKIIGKIENHMMIYGDEKMIIKNQIGDLKIYHLL
jgi:hypothetical protein